MTIINGMKRAIAAFLLLAACYAAFADDAALAERRKKTILYGIDSELLDLVKALDSEKNSAYDEELLALLGRTRSPKVQENVLNHFAATKFLKAEAFAIKLVKDDDPGKITLTIAAINYLGEAGLGGANTELRKFVDRRESSFLVPSIRTIGKTASAEDAAWLSALFAKGSDMGESARMELLVALGRIKAAAALPDIIKACRSKDENRAVRMSACEALGAYLAKEGFDALVAVSDDDDPYVRLASIQAVDKFPGEDADASIVEGLRDESAKVRIFAAERCGARKIAASADILAYKLENDPEPKVKDASLAALAALGGPSLSILRDIVKDAKRAAAQRLLAFRLLLANDEKGSWDALNAVLLTAAAETNPLFYQSLAKEATSAKDPRSEAWFRLFLSDKNYIVQLMAIDAFQKGAFPTVKDAVQALADGSKAEMVRKKAKEAIDALAPKPAADTPAATAPK